MALLPLTPAEGSCTFDIATYTSGQPPDPANSILTNRGVVQHAELIESFDSWAVSAILFQAASDSYAADVLAPIMSQTLPLVWFRIVIDSGGGTPVARPWEPHWLTYHQSLAQNDSSPMVLIQTADILYQIDRTERTAYYSGPLHTHATAAFNASAPGVKVITEPTNQKYTLYQSNQTDWSYIRDRLKPRALNAAGQGGYKVYARSDASGTPSVIFATTAYSGVGANTWDVQQSPASALGKIKFSDRSRLRANGAAGASAVAATTYTPAPVGQSMANTGDALKLGTVPPNIPNGEMATILAHVGENTQTELQALAQNQFDEASLDIYRAEFEVAQVPLIRIGDFAQVTTTMSNKQWDGLYVIAHLKSVVVRGALKTQVTSIRGQTDAPGGTTTTVAGANASVTPDPSGAPNGGWQPPPPIALRGDAPASNDDTGYGGGPTLPAADANVAPDDASATSQLMGGSNVPEPVGTPTSSKTGAAVTVTPQMRAPNP